MIIINIGGEALTNGIVFRSDYKKATGVIDKNGDIKIYVEDLPVAKSIFLNNMEYYIYKIPFIRGIYNLMKVKYMLIITCIFIITSLVLKYISKPNPKGTYDLTLNLYTLAICVVLIIALAIVMIRIFIDMIKEFIKIKALFAFHGAEHKAINTLEEKRELNINEVKKSSRKCYRCGSNLLIFSTLIILILVNFLKLNLFIINIISFSIAYELFNIEDGESRFFISLFYKIGSIIQEKIITREPDEKQIELAILTLKELEKEESKFEINELEIEN